MDPLFPELTEDLNGLSDEELVKAEEEFRAAVQLIVEDDKDFLGDRDAEDVIAQLETGVESIEKIVAERDGRAVAAENYDAKKAELVAKIAPKEEPVAEVSEEETLEVKAEDEPAPDDPSEPDPTDEEKAEETVEEKELVTASVETPEPTPVRLRRAPPAPAPERIPASEPAGTALVAAGEMGLQYREPLTEMSLANLVKDAAMHHGPHPKVDPEGKYRFGGPEHKIARADFPFPEERTLTADLDSNLEKIRAIGNPYFGQKGRDVLVASGGLCAPSTPFYTMPNFATEAEPAWDSLPVFRANRGGVNVPAATYIADITSAISSISEANDALGGTFATKSCQDLDCPEYTETFVQILAHCREYGNLNAIAWPEKIAHENTLTMAALSRTTETFMLNRIKALSINVTQAEILGAYGDLVHALTKAAAGIRYRLRMTVGARFNVVIPEWIADLLVADTAYTQFDRFQAQAAMVAHLESLGFRVTLYKDDVTGGTSQGFAAEAAGALDDYPDDVQYAIFPEGQFLGIDMGVLELGIVRDSTLNSTNDFQVFGERFRNLAMLGPAQGALWVTQGVCPSGEFPALGTALAC